MRSATRPKITSSAANASAYALTTHDSSPRPAPLKSAAIDGNAMLTIVTSRYARNVPAAASQNTGHGSVVERAVGGGAAARP